jgi:hypothetical protein
LQPAMNSEARPTPKVFMNSRRVRGDIEPPKDQPRSTWRSQASGYFQKTFPEADRQLF